MTNNYLDARTEEERKDDSKMKSVTTTTKSFEERFDEFWEEKCVASFGSYYYYAPDMLKEFIRSEKQLSYEEGKKEERERQYDLIMSCLPSDAENLSTLTPDQAFRLIRSFISRNPWD